jgi:hypothetical protein
MHFAAAAPAAPAAAGAAPAPPPTAAGGAAPAAPLAPPDVALVLRAATVEPAAAAGAADGVAGLTKAEAAQAGREELCGVAFFRLAAEVRRFAALQGANPESLSLSFVFGERQGGYDAAGLLHLTGDFARRARLDHLSWVVDATRGGNA